ncbi:MAG: tyrosine-type recombinase/integrase [Thermoanaerobaculia bacterium]
MTPTDSLTAARVGNVLAAAREGATACATAMQTLYHHGLRVSELCRLTLPDLDLEAGTLWVSDGSSQGARGLPPGAGRRGPGTPRLPRRAPRDGTLASRRSSSTSGGRRSAATRSTTGAACRRSRRAPRARCFRISFADRPGSKLVGEGHDVRLIVQDYLGLRTARSVLKFVEKPAEGADAQRVSGLWGEAGGDGGRRFQGRSTR